MSGDSCFLSKAKNLLYDINDKSWAALVLNAIDNKRLCEGDFEQ